MRQISVFVCFMLLLCGCIENGGNNKIDSAIIVEDFEINIDDLSSVGIGNNKELGLFYINEELSFVFDIPDNWEDNYYIEEIDDTIKFYHISGYDYNALFFEIKSFSQDFYDDYKDDMDFFFIVNNEKNIYLNLTVEVSVEYSGTYDKEIVDEFLDLKLNRKELTEHIYIY